MTKTEQRQPGTALDPADGAQWTQRLFCIEYGCPLCGSEHEAEVYVKHETNSLDELHAHGRRILRNGVAAIPLLAAHLSFVHTERGDYTTLREEADRSGPRGTLRIISIEMTGESEVSCDQCAHRFDDTQTLWEHQGVDPRTSTRVREPACSGAA